MFELVSANADHALAAGPAINYRSLKAQAAADRQLLLQRWRTQRVSVARRFEELELRLLAQIDQLQRAWLGTRWGLGMPQTIWPQQGKVNCGLFVALVLRDAGFNFNIWKFNRQASYHAIKSLAPRRTIRYFHRVPMDKFLASVHRLGPGLFIIGLDFHIGFLRLEEGRGLRFIHASYVTGKVMDEPAERAIPIVTSNNRMVGKILQRTMLRAWLGKRRIKILGPR